MKPVDVARPSEITVDGALNDVAQGLNNFRKVGAATNTRYGLIVDEVTVTLKITASANDRSKLVVDVANVAPTVLQGGNAAIHAEQGGDSSGTRDNTIVVKLKNVYTAQLNAVGLQQKPIGDRIGLGTIFQVPSDQGFERSSQKRTINQLRQTTKSRGEIRLRQVQGTRAVAAKFAVRRARCFIEPES